MYINVRPLCVDFGLNIHEIVGQRWLPPTIFSFNRRYLRNYRRYEKIVNMFFVATIMYFPKMQKILHFTSILRAFLALDWMCPFWVKRHFWTFSGFCANLGRIIFSFFFLEGIMICLSNFQYYFEIWRPVEISTRPIFGEPTNKKFEKIQNFKMS